MRMGWWERLFEGRAAGDATSLQTLLSRIWRQETVLAIHLADRARAVRFAPDRSSLEGLAALETQNACALAREIEGGATLATAPSPPRRPGTLTATKLIQDLTELDDLYALYRQARWLTPDAALRGRLEGLAAEEARSSQTIRGILARMDSYVTDRALQAAEKGPDAMPRHPSSGWVSADGPVSAAC